MDVSAGGDTDMALAPMSIPDLLREGINETDLHIVFLACRTVQMQPRWSHVLGEFYLGVHSTQRQLELREAIAERKALFQVTRPVVRTFLYDVHVMMLHIEDEKLLETQMRGMNIEVVDKGELRYLLKNPTKHKFNDVKGVVAKGEYKVQRPSLRPRYWNGEHGHLHAWFPAKRNVDGEGR